MRLGAALAAGQFLAVQPSAGDDQIGLVQPRLPPELGFAGDLVLGREAAGPGLGNHGSQVWPALRASLPKRSDVLALARASGRVTVL